MNELLKLAALPFVAFATMAADMPWWLVLTAHFPGRVSARPLITPRTASGIFVPRPPGDIRRRRSSMRSAWKGPSRSARGCSPSPPRSRRRAADPRLKPVVRCVVHAPNVD